MTEHGKGNTVTIINGRDDGRVEAIWELKNEDQNYVTCRNGDMTWQEFLDAKAGAEKIFGPIEIDDKRVPA